MNVNAYDKEIIVDLNLAELKKMQVLIEKAIGTAELIEKLQNENKVDPVFTGFHPVTDYFEYDGETIKFGINSVKENSNNNPELEDV